MVPPKAVRKAVSHYPLTVGYVSALVLTAALLWILGGL
jgi:hypothetical protein